MLNWFNKYQKEILQICEELSWDHFTVTEWALISKTLTLLKPFSQHTKLLEGELYITISLAIPSLIELNSHLENIKSTFPDQKIIDFMQNELKRRFKIFTNPSEVNCDPIFLTATLYDPQFALCLNSEQLECAIKYSE